MKCDFNSCALPYGCSGMPCLCQTILVYVFLMIPHDHHARKTIFSAWPILDALAFSMLGLVFGVPCLFHGQRSVIDLLDVCGWSNSCEPFSLLDWGRFWIHYLHFIGLRKMIGLGVKAWHHAGSMRASSKYCFNPSNFSWQIISRDYFLLMRFFWWALNWNYHERGIISKR